MARSVRQVLDSPSDGQQRRWRETPSFPGGNNAGGSSDRGGLADRVKNAPVQPLGGRPATDPSANSTSSPGTSPNTPSPSPAAHSADNPAATNAHNSTAGPEHTADDRRQSVLDKLGGAKDAKESLQHPIEAAKEAGKEAAKQVVKQATRKVAMAVATSPLTWIAVFAVIVIIFIIFVAVNFWDHPSAVLSLATHVVAHFLGIGMGNVILNGGASRLAYEVPVGSDGHAIAANVQNYNPATAPQPGTYAYKLSKIDWEKAKYQTQAPDTNCNIVTQQVAAPDGTKRSVVQRVELKNSPGQDLEGLARANCLDNSYPIFNATIRSQYIRDNLNQQLGVRYAYALPQGSKELDGKSDTEAATYLRNKTLERINQHNGGGVSNYSVNTTPTDYVSSCEKGDTICLKNQQNYIYVADGKSITDEIAACANTFDFSIPNDIDTPDKNIEQSIKKARNDLKCGIPPEKLNYMYQLPSAEELSTTDPVLAKRRKLTALDAMCAISRRLYADDSASTSKAINDYKTAVKDRIASEANAAQQALTYSSTNRDHFLSLRELSGDAYKVLGMGNSQEYDHAVNNETFGEASDSGAVSRAFGLANIHPVSINGAAPAPTYNDDATINAQETLQALTDPNRICGVFKDGGLNGMKPSFLRDSTDPNVVHYTDAVIAYFDNYFPKFQSALTTLDTYAKDSKGNVLDIPTATGKVNINELFIKLVKIQSNAATAGNEEGTQNFDRMNIGMTAYKNALSLSMGGSLLTANQSVTQENMSRSSIAYDDRTHGLGWRIFNHNNPSSVFSRVAVASLDKPNKIAANVASVIGNLFNPVKNLVGSRDSLAYSLTGESHIAEASNSYEINNLRLDPAGLPDGFSDINPLTNAAAIEGILSSQNTAAKVLIYNWELCMRESIPSRFHLLNPPAGKEDMYKNYCQPLLDITAPTHLSNAGIIDQITRNPMLNVNDPRVKSDLGFMYRAYHFYTLQAENMLYLSNPEATDESYDAASSAAINATLSSDTADSTDPVGPIAVSGTDTSAIPCPAGTIDKGIAIKYGVGRVAQHSLRLCNVQGITVNVSIAASLNSLLNDSRASGIKFGGGGFRTFDQQVGLRISHGCPNLSAPSSSCSPPTAIPGQSNHENGEAIDFTQGGSSITSSSSGYTWLQANAAKYGLKNFPRETWHWSVDGR